MADAALSFAIENVGNFVIENAKFLVGLRDEVEEMQIELEWMQCFLRDAERRQRESLRVRNWVSQIREAAYDVEDVIERFALKSALRSRVGVVNRIKRYVFFIKHVVELHQVGSKIEAIKSRLTKLRTRLRIYGIKELRVGSAVSSWRKRQDYAHVIDHNVVGLDYKISELVTQLLDIDQEDHPIAARRSDSVICISGMGGLGKTTLAKQVYGNSRVKGHFEGFAWVYISQQFNERDVWESILSQLSDKMQKEMIQRMSNDELTSELCKVQREKKYLVVIDDIWSNEAWVKISPAFPYMEDDNKSKILLTTRNKDVALHGVYHTGLNTLDDTNSLELLINTIRFLGGSHHPIKDNLILEQRACEMVKQCAGLPLAITVLGGILATKHELKEWERVGDNIKLLLNRGNQKEDIGVSSVLESSYYDLPYNLKSCFLYLSHYPEDHEIRTAQLIQRWMGEGYVVSPECVFEGDETMEDVGEQYLNELLSRCMIQVGRRSYTGRVKTCRMHDLMRDLCISKAREENFTHLVNVDGLGNKTRQHPDKTKSNGNIRRICIFSRELDLPLPFRREIFPQLRSLLWLHQGAGVSILLLNRMSFILKNLKLCRVLVLERKGSNITTSMEMIANLHHLRYLRIEIGRYKDTVALGSSMGNLSWLQTLDLRGCSVLKLSNSVWMMEQLRHLYLPDRCECETRKQRVGSFRDLQTLTNFPPDNFDLKQNLVKFTNVRKLGLNGQSGGLEEIGEVFRGTRLVFTRLHSLSINAFFYVIDLEAITTGCPNLYKLRVFGQIKNPAVASICLWPPNLTKLVLRNSQLDANYLEPLGKLQSLKILFVQFDSFIGKEMIFHENDFPQLQHLLLHKLKEVEAWTVHEGALPSLSRLEIDECKKLNSVPVRFQNLKQLKELQVRKMPYNFRKRLESGGDDWHKVSHVPSISFMYCDPAINTQNWRTAAEKATSKTKK